MKNNNDRKTKDLYSISNIINPIAREILGKNGFIEIDIITNWNKIVGKELAKFTIPQKIDFARNQKNNGTLHVQVASGAFAIELQHKENKIINQINTFFGYNAVSKIKISQNSKAFETFFEEKQDEKNKKSLVTNEEETYINEITKDVKNAELKEILTKIGYSIANINNKDVDDQ